MVRPACVNQGFITIIGVLVAGLIALAISSAMLFFGVGFSGSVLSIQQSYQAKGLARACADLGLLQIHNNITYTGTGNLTLGDGICTYVVTSSGGSNRKVISSGVVNSITKKIEITINALSPKIVISSWQDVADFTP
jgi:hypothetical protein